MKQVTIYTDGACSGNPGPGGWAAILICDGREKEISGGEKDTTNNRMELMGVISALSALKEPCNVDLYTDSQYIASAINEGWLENWKRNNWRRKEGPVKNPDLWRLVDALISTHSVSFHWVHGHSEDKINARCDKLAVAQRKIYAKM